MREVQERLLGHLLQAGEGAEHVVDLLQPSDFDPPLDRVYAEVVRRVAEGLAYDYTSVSAALRREDKGMEGVVLSLLVSANGAKPEDVRRWAQEIHEWGRRKRVRSAAQALIDALSDPSVSVDEALSGFDAALVREVALEKGPEDAMAEWIRYASATDSIWTPWEELNGIIGPVRSGNVVIVGGRPGSGKTSFLLQWALYLAAQSHHVAIVSLEMSAGELWRRMASIYTRHEAQEFDPHHPNFERAVEKAKRLSTFPFRIYDFPAITLPVLRAVLSRMRSAGKLDAVFLDYVPLLTPHRRYRSMEQEIAAISRGLKELALSLGVPMIVASQLNREIERRGDETPRLADLRASGSLEQDADLIMVLTRDKREFSDDDVADDEAEDGLLPDLPRASDRQVYLRHLHVIKHRHGRTGKLPMYLHGPTTTIFDHPPTDEDIAAPQEVVPF